MITTNITQNNPFNIAFAMRKDIPKEFIKNRISPIKVEAMVDKKKKEIEIHDFHAIAFESLYLAEYIIRLGTGQSVESVQQGLVKRYGKEISNTLIYIVLYKEV